MCMYYNPVSYTYIHRQAFFQVNGASFYCGHKTKIVVTREKLDAAIAFSRQTQLTLSSSNSTFLNKSHDRTFCLSCMKIIYKFLEATLLYLNSPFFHLFVVFSVYQELQEYVFKTLIDKLAIKRPFFRKVRFIKLSFCNFFIKKIQATPE